MKRRVFMQYAFLATALADARAAFQLPAGRTWGDAVTGMAKTNTGTWLVSHRGEAGAVSEFSAEGKFLRDLAPAHAGAGAGVDVSLEENERILVLASYPGGISFLLALDAQGQTLWETPIRGAVAHAALPRGEIAVALAGMKHAVVILSAGGEELRRFGKKGRGVGEIFYPTAISFKEDLHLTDQAGKRIQRFALSGKWLGAETLLELPSHEDGRGWRTCAAETLTGHALPGAVTH